MSVEAQYQALLESEGEDAAKRYLELARSPLHIPIPDAKSGIHCPHCGFNESLVLDSRKGETSIRRRRSCTNCQHRISTLEYPEEAIAELRQYRESLTELLKPVAKAHSLMDEILQKLDSILDNED